MSISAVERTAGSHAVAAAAHCERLCFLKHPNKRMPSQRIPRSTDELVQRLELHCKLLQEYHDRACTGGEESYLGEIAGKLRLLVYRGKSNRPLLLDLMKKTDINILAQFDKPRGKIEKSLEEYIYGFLTAMRLPSGELIELTRHQFIGLWSQQVGASHEDWNLDERLVVAFNQNILINNQLIAARGLCGICRTVLAVARHFLEMYRQRKET